MEALRFIRETHKPFIGEINYDIEDEEGFKYLDYLIRYCHKSKSRLDIMTLFTNGFIPSTWHCLNLSRDDIDNMNYCCCECAEMKINTSKHLLDIYESFDIDKYYKCCMCYRDLKEFYMINDKFVDFDNRIDNMSIKDIKYQIVIDLDFDTFNRYKTILQAHNRYDELKEYLIKNSDNGAKIMLVKLYDDYENENVVKCLMSNISVDKEKINDDLIDFIRDKIKEIIRDKKIKSSLYHLYSRCCDIYNEELEMLSDCLVDDEMYLETNEYERDVLKQIVIMLKMKGIEMKYQWMKKI